MNGTIQTMPECQKLWYRQASIVMAHMIMAHFVTAYILMAYVFMACKVIDDPADIGV